MSLHCSFTRIKFVRSVRPQLKIRLTGESSPLFYVCLCVCPALQEGNDKGPLKFDSCPDKSFFSSID